MVDKRMTEDMPQGTEPVDIIASGYEWMCPTCETLVLEIEHTEIVTCSECNKSYYTSPPLHAHG